MGYSKKASKPTGGSSNVDWDEFNQHLLEEIGTDLEPRVAILSGIIDLGIQSRQDYVEKYKKTPKQEQALSEGKSYLTEDKKEIVTPQDPKEQIAFMADFPEVMINYGKYFGEDQEDDWKPYRHLVMGTYWDAAKKDMVAKGATLSCRPDDKAPSGYAYDGKSTISKLATTTGASTAPVDQDFELGDLLGGVFMMDLQAVEDGKYVNVKAKNISSKHKAVPVPDYDLEPFGIEWDGGNDEEELQQVRAQLWTTIKRAANWDESGLKKDYEAFQKSKKSTTANEEEAEEEEAEEEKPKKTPPKKVVGKKPPAKKAPAKKAVKQEEEDDEDDCPFE